MEKAELKEDINRGKATIARLEKELEERQTEIDRLKQQHEDLAKQLKNIQ
jgi:chromosome segregation ATPase